HLTAAERADYYREFPWAETEYYQGLQTRHNEYYRNKEGELAQQQRRTDVAVGAVNEILAFEGAGALTAVGIGTAGVGGFAKGLGHGALYAGSTSEGGFRGCGAIAGLGPAPKPRSPTSLSGFSEITSEISSEELDRYIGGARPPREITEEVRHHATV